MLSWTLHQQSSHPISQVVAYQSLASLDQRYRQGIGQRALDFSDSTQS